MVYLFSFFSPIVMVWGAVHSATHAVQTKLKTFLPSSRPIMSVVVSKQQTKFYLTDVVAYLVVVNLANTTHPYKTNMMIDVTFVLLKTSPKGSVKNVQNVSHVVILVSKINLVPLLTTLKIV